MKKLFYVICLTLIYFDAKAKICLLSFDGSGYLSMWKDTLEFAKQENVKFTYFVSAPYFVTEEDCRDHPYWAETEIGEPYCKIRQDDEKNGVNDRFEYIKRAISEGHEIASHLCGHYDGSKWTYDQWKKEFEFFRWALNRNDFDADTITGIRAPYLGVNKDYFKVCREFGYQYDSSLGCCHPTMNENFPEVPIKKVWITGYGPDRKILPFDAEFDYRVKPTLPLLPEGYTTESIMEQIFFDTLCDSYIDNGEPGAVTIDEKEKKYPLQICLHFFQFKGQPYLKAMEEFVKWAKQQPDQPQFLTYKEYAKTISR